MDYFVTDVGEAIKLALDESRFAALKRAKEITIDAIAVEENFDVVLESYVELEETLFHLGMTHLAFGHRSKYKFNNMRNLISRRLLNLFSSIRLYRDALTRLSPKILDRGGSADKIREAIRDSSQQTMAFRVIEAARNYSQHQSLLVNGLALASRWDGPDKKSGRLAYSITPTLDGETISRNGRLPDDVKLALSSMARAEIMPLVRVALEGWGAIHASFRQEIRSLTDNAENLIRNAITSVESAAEPDTIASDLSLLVRQENGTEIESIQLFGGLFEILSDFRHKSGTLANLSRRYVDWSDRER